MAKQLEGKVRSGSTSAKTAPRRSAEPLEQDVVYVSPLELTQRWRCSRSTVDRIAERARLTRICLGEGRNGIIRYFRKEIEEFEQSRILSQ